MKADKIVAHINLYIAALEQIAALPKQHTGRRGEEIFNDMEDAFTNGCEVGEYEALVQAAKIAKDALKGLPSGNARCQSTISDVRCELARGHGKYHKSGAGGWEE